MPGFQLDIFFPQKSFSSITIWGSSSIQNRKAIESIQRQFTKRICMKLNIKFNSYQERLTLWNVKTLEQRRIELDLILVYKILNGLIYLKPGDFFKKSNFYNNHNLRRHNQCLQSYEIPRTNIRKNFFSIRIIKLWNQLPQNIVSSKSLSSFKSNLKKLDLRSFTLQI